MDFIVIFLCLIVIYFDNIYYPLLPSFVFSKISVLFYFLIKVLFLSKTSLSCGGWESMAYLLL